MSPSGPIPPSNAGIAASTAGSLSTGASERAAKLDAANHSLSAGQKALASHPLDRDPSTSADRDADGWTGGNGDEGDTSTVPSGSATAARSDESPPRPRLPDDPCGGSLDVTV